MSLLYPVEPGKPYYSSLKLLRWFFLYSESAGFMIVFSLQILFFTVGCPLHLYMAVSGKLEGNIGEDINVALPCTIMFVMNSKFRQNRKRWSKFFMEITDFKKFGKPTTFDKITARTNLFSKIYMIYCVTGTIFYGVVARFESTCSQISDDSPYKDFCGTFTPIWFPMEKLPMNLKIAVSLLQLLAAMHVTTCTAICCALTFESTEFIISHEKYLKEKLLAVYENDGTSKFSKLKSCVNYQNHIYELTKELDRLTNSTTGLMSIMCSLVSGCISNMIFKGKPFEAITFLVGFMMAMFLLCYSGQRIMDESLSVADIAYESDWYNGTTQMTTMMRIIIARSQIPSTISASPCGVYGFPLFLMILKASYSYMTLLRQST